MSIEEPAPPLSAAEIARRLREAREAAGLTQRELARRAQVSSSLSVHELERGEAANRTRNPLTLARLARALDKHWTYLGAAPPSDLPSGPGRALCQARLAHGWTLRQLATASGVNRTTINRLEHGTRGTLASWQAVAQALGLNPADFGRPY